jgi:hypothetical protein
MCISFIANAQYKIPEKPNILYPVYDEAGFFLKQKNKHLTKNSSNLKTLLLQKLKSLLSLLPKAKM